MICTICRYPIILDFQYVSLVPCNNTKKRYCHKQCYIKVYIPSLNNQPQLTKV